MIDIRNVSFEYKDAQALRDVSVKIEKGESLAIIGPNGSGKSTFLKLLNALIFPDEGKYIFNGEEITQKKMQEGP
jgi:cobalt/nickel transport system ATP-binding protein